MRTFLAFEFFVSVRDSDLSNKVAFITGSAGGLGKEFATRILEAGGRVCLSDVKAEVGLVTKSQLEERFGCEAVHFVTCDVTKEASLRAAFEETCHYFEVKGKRMTFANTSICISKSCKKLLDEAKLFRWTNLTSWSTTQASWARRRVGNFASTSRCCIMVSDTITFT